MDVAAVMALIIKGLGVVSTLVAVGKETAPAISVLVNLAKGAQAGTVTDAELTATEATLDDMISDFNAPIT